MAKDKKGRVFYNVTKEKPSGKSQILLAGASGGAVISFFMVSVLGSLYSIEMDSLVFYFMLSSIVGFFVGGILTWLFVRNFSKVISASEMLVPEATEMKPMADAQPETASEPTALTEEDKGQSVDFVFPELSPDK
jgi:hypothetical protein